MTMKATSIRKPVVVSIRPNGRVDIDIPAVGGLDGFDKLKQFLQNEHLAVVKSCVEGPDIRQCIFNVGIAELELIYEDPYGNSIRSIGPDSGRTVEEIGRDLERRLVKT